MAIMMKKILWVILLNSFSIALIPLNLYAQVASGTWALTNDQSASVAGNIVCDNQSISNMQVSYPGTAQRSSPTGTAGTWSQENTENSTRYFQFKISPSTGNNLTISSITMFLYANSGSHMYANVYYSLDTTAWSTSKIQIQSSAPLPSTAPSNANVSSTGLTLTVSDGNTLYIRVYPWNNNTGGTTGKYVMTSNVIISGSTASSVTPSLTVSPTSISFGSIDPNTNKDSSYTISGSNLSPSNGNIIITPTIAYQVSTTRGSNYSPTITLPYTNGALPLTTIYVRFTPIAQSTEYKGDIVHTGGGASQYVAVSGTGSSPRIIVTPAALAFGTLGRNSSKEKQYTISGNLLSPSSGFLKITASKAFQITTTSGTGYNQSLSLPYSGGVLGSTTIYVKFHPTSDSSYNSTITNSGGTAPSQYILVSGKGLASDTVTPNIFGAYADGIHKDTKAIQAAIDSVYKIGGGIVWLPSGYYLTGPIVLKSFVTLLVDSTAKILGSQYLKDYYPAGSDTNLTVAQVGSLNPLITSNNATDITITGKGTIDGQGYKWWSPLNTPDIRPRLIQLNYSPNLLIENVFLTNPGQFHVSLQWCNNVIVRNITIETSPTSPNTDGIDPATCHNVQILNCTIDVGDDNIAVKSGSSDPRDPHAACSNILISGCTFLHGHGVSIGSETSGGVDSMTVTNCTFNSTDNGLRIKSDRPTSGGNGGNVRGIKYSNITMINVKYPIYITGYYSGVPAQTDPAQPITSTTPFFHDISFTNITAVSGYYSNSAGFIYGLPEEIFTNIHFNNVNIENNKGLTVRNAIIDTIKTKIAVTSGSPFIIQVNGIVHSTVTSVNNEVLPSNYYLSQNYPNPFNPTTIIIYQLPVASHVILKVFDILGREVATLVNNFQPAGKYKVSFNEAKQLTSGIYFYRINTSNFVQTKKMLLIK